MAQNQNAKSYSQRRLSKDRSSGDEGSPTRRDFEQIMSANKAKREWQKRTKKRKDSVQDPNSVSALSQHDEVYPTRKVLVGNDISNLQIRESDLRASRGEPSQVCELRPSREVAVRVKKSAAPCSPALSSPNRLSETQTIRVAKVADSDAVPRASSTGATGALRFNHQGRFLRHSILGPLDDYVKRSQLEDDVQLPAINPDDLESPRPASVVSDRPGAEALMMKKPSLDVPESEALLNWQRQMRERRKQENYLSRLLGKDSRQLAMNEGDRFRQKQEMRELIDNTLPLVAHGKGYRFHSEFWNQPLLFGDDLLGVHSTLNLGQQGCGPPVKFVGVPPTVQREKGSGYAFSNGSKPWHRCDYAMNRLSQLRGLIEGFYPHLPEFEGLEVVGGDYDRVQQFLQLQQQLHEGGTMHQTGVSYADEEGKPLVSSPTIDELGIIDEGDENDDPLADFPDATNAPVMGPGLEFAGKQLCWTGESSSQRDTVALEARVTFESFCLERTPSSLDVKNIGTTAMFYSWQKIEPTNPFQIYRQRVQRFYFDTSEGVILPGDTKTFHFIFKSTNAGVYSERWRFIPRPAVESGAALVVTLRGVCLRKDLFKPAREQIEAKLRHEEGSVIARKLLDQLVAAVRTPDRPPTPVDAYISNEQLFERNNPGLYYKSKEIRELCLIISRAVRPPSAPPSEHDAASTSESRSGRAPSGKAHTDRSDRASSSKLPLDAHPAPPAAEPGGDAGIDAEENEFGLTVLGPISDLKAHIFSNLDEDDGRKEPLLAELEEVTMRLAFPPDTPRADLSAMVGNGMLRELVDSVVTADRDVCTYMGLPEKPTEQLASAEYFAVRQDSPTKDVDDGGPKGGRKSTRSNRSEEQAQRDAAAAEAAAAKSAEKQKRGSADSRKSRGSDKAGGGGQTGAAATAKKGAAVAGGATQSAAAVAAKKARDLSASSYTVGGADEDGSAFGRSSPRSETERVVEGKHRSKIDAMCYNLLVDGVERLSLLLDEASEPVDYCNQATICDDDNVR